jgi:N-acylethanolamine-hydrolysing acid amidase
MMTYSIVVVLALALIVTPRGSPAMRVAPTFTVDLAKPPEQRWIGAVGTVLALHAWEYSFEPLMTYYQSTFVDLVSDANQTAVLRVVERRFPEEFAELSGIAADFAAHGHPEVSVQWLSLWFWFHELSHAAELNMGLPECTAILVAPTDLSSPLVHGRNLDQMPLEARNITLTLTFVNSSNTVDPSVLAPILFQAVDMYWMSGGFVTGFKSGHATMQENWRFNVVPLPLSVILDRIVTDDSVVPQVHMFRYALTGQRGAGPAADFDSIVRFLNRSTFASPYYAVVSGTQRRGAVISASFDHADNRVMFLGSVDFPDHPWYLVQTNWNQWSPDQGRMRRTHAEANIADLGQDEGATHLGVWQAISAYPVHNEGTFYTVVMDVSMLAIRGIIRQPLMPWNASCTSRPPLQ